MDINVPKCNSKGFRLGKKCSVLKDIKQLREQEAEYTKLVWGQCKHSSNFQGCLYCLSDAVNRFFIHRLCNASTYSMSPPVRELHAAHLRELCAAPLSLHMLPLQCPLYKWCKLPYVFLLILACGVSLSMGATCSLLWESCTQPLCYTPWQMEQY